LTRLLLLLSVLPWLSLFRLGRRSPRLADNPARRGRHLTIIIPARNEASNIAGVVQSILRSSYTPFELLVVDDRSSDETSTIVRAIAAREPRVRLIPGAALPPGWFGKPWACSQGAAEARGELLLFTDADTRHSPGLHERAVGALETQQAHLVTISPRLLCLTFWERVVMPQIFLPLAARFHPRAVNRARHRRNVIANGQFILVTRESYDRVGGHASVRSSVAEDLALAQEYQRHGERIYFAFAEEFMETRMYRSLRELVDGWSKNVYLGSRHSYPEEPWRRALAPVMLLGFMLYWLAPIPMLLLFPPGTEGLRLVGAAMASSVVFWALIVAALGIPPWYGLLYPLGATIGLYIVLRSMRRGSRRVDWRGRVYRVEAKDGREDVRES
jgi:chlorobactene glucosyltransferase